MTLNLMLCTSVRYTWGLNTIYPSYTFFFLFPAHSHSVVYLGYSFETDFPNACLSHIFKWQRIPTNKKKMTTTKKKKSRKRSPVFHNVCDCVRSGYILFTSCRLNVFTVGRGREDSGGPKPPNRGAIHQILG